LPDISKFSGTLIDGVSKVDGVLKGDIASIVGLTVPSSGAYTPPLDTYTGATAAYSVRKLSSSYSGSCIEAYRVSDGATQDIGFDADGLIDTAAIISFASGGEVRVRTWYDQSGNALDAVQTASANMARIYDGSSIYEDNGNPAVDFNNNQFFSVGSSQWTDGAMMASIVFSRRSGNDTYWTSNGAVFRLFYESIKHGFIHYGTTPNSTEKGSAPASGQLLTTSRFGGGSADLYENGTSVASSPTVTGSMSTASVGAFMAQRSDGALRMDGTIQELIHWGSDQTSNRTGVEINLNDYYQIANLPASSSGLLYDYPDAAAAYSVRSLSNNAIKCMRVRRTVAPFDEQDIGFDSNGDLDTAAITTFGGSDPLTVSVWYDQSGLSNDATQATAGSQPTIYDGAAVITDNGKPIISRVNSSTGFSPIAVDMSGSTISMTSVSKISVDNSIMAWFGSTLAERLFTSTSGSSLTDGGQAGFTVSGAELFFNGSSQGTGVTRGEAYTQFNNNQTLATWVGLTGLAATTINLSQNVGYWQMHDMQEIIFWESDQSSNRTGIESNINGYYSID
jgi:hypothetical protein